MINNQTQKANDSWKRIAIFLVITFILGAAAYVLKAKMVDDRLSRIFSLVLIFIPAAGAILTQLITGRSLGEFAWKLKDKRYLLWSVLLPVGIALVVYIIVWIVMGGFYDESIVYKASGLLKLKTDDPVIALGAYFLFFCTIYFVWAIIMSLGSELGWQGVLVPALAKQTSFTTTALITGIVYVVWDLPWFLFFSKSEFLKLEPVWGIVWPSVGALASGFVLTWLRLKTQSLWPPVFFRATYGVFVIWILHFITAPTPSMKYVVGSFGCALPACLVVLAFVLWLKRPLGEGSR
ncbi:MAG: CPBP family intramembrane metalloprotease [Candidatus Aminicenantes bacterium]|nr:CPBP family intramembrane metalloprotease [Candidatus Aminicenantes bacterium]NIM84423.1 CPBP family intramembrane metalloprotease [Candidatus Aminicenantes bacterium]NIN23902.1 CPBP family intramembrane metalloprotease [Candidatus Aminicenantes bacterium]NIN47618.1 CPBP family intramembrane metalloprotease [Candidatus Aminicenantes bacterium]NIN90547.1 CPBP family intramembrane metalloprotease [Candidatus Aminicenantes bacterium]